MSGVLWCHEALWLATARRAGLSDADALRLEQHVAGCARCAVDLPLLDTLADVGRSAGVSGDGAIARRALGRALAGEAPRVEPARRPSWRTAVPVVLAAAVGLVLAVGLGSGAIDVAASGGRASGSASDESTGHAHATTLTRLAVAHGALELEPGTDVSWSGAVVSLHEGRVRAVVDPGPHLPFRVETADFAVHVTGTRFEVTLRSVHVTEGSVEVRTLGGVLMASLHAGQSWELLPDATAASDEPSATLAPAAAALDERIEAVASPAGAEPLPRARSRAALDLESTASATERPAARERFARAAMLEASAPDEAATLYEALEGEGGAWGRNALFARASLALTRGRRDEARTLFARYLELHPDGPNAADARALLDRE